MGGFEFKKNDLNIEIVGNVFHIDYNNDFQNRCLEFSEKCMSLAEEIGKSKNDAEAVKKTCKYCKEAINTLLGDETASEKIFAGRKDNMMDCIDVISYIFDEVDKFKSSQMDKIKNFARNRTKNRQQRRHEKRHK